MRLFTLIAQVPLDIVDAQRGRLFLWLPVCFGIGIGVFFAQSLEPSVTLLGVILAGVILGLLALIKTPPRVAPLLIAMLTVSMGFFAAGLRSHMVSEPVLTFRYYGPVEGRVIHIDRSASDALRLTLDRVTLRNFSPDRTPYKVRISLYGPKLCRPRTRYAPCTDRPFVAALRPR